MTHTLPIIILGSILISAIAALWLLLSTSPPAETRVSTDSATVTNLEPEASTSLPVVTMPHRGAPNPAPNRQATSAPRSVPAAVPAPTPPSDLEILEDQINALIAQTDDPESHSLYGQYKEIVNPAGFVNSDPFQLADLVGEHVVLLKFTTYSCINCTRTYPYIIDWHQKYEDQGLAVVFIHTPEFAFEKNITNVRAAMAEAGITFPVVLDNDYSTWRAYGNRFWPRTYLIDHRGNIVYDHIGEGAYAETEAKIVEMLGDL